MFIVGVTGGIGAGKTSVTNAFAKLGIDIIDSDVIAREVVVKGSHALAAIAEHFGSSILNTNGELDRSQLRQRIFSHSAEKHWLESLLHPLIRERTQKQLHEAKSDYCILSSPLLLETNQRDLVQRVLVVDIVESEQIARTSLRDGNDPEQIQKIIASQMPRAERLAAADDVIDNSGTKEETRLQVKRLHASYLRYAEAYLKKSNR